MTTAIRRAERSVPSPRTLSWLLALPERRTAKQTALVDKICAACPTLVLCRDLVLSFQDMMHRRAVGELDGWLERAVSSHLSAFATFVRGIRADIEAVRVARSLRGQGLGRRLLEWAIAECRARGCGMVQLTTNSARTDAHRFYAGLGFKPSHIGFKLPLTQA